MINIKGIYSQKLMTLHIILSGNIKSKFYSSQNISTRRICLKETHFFFIVSHHWYFLIFLNYFFMSLINLFMALFVRHFVASNKSGNKVSYCNRMHYRIKLCSASALRNKREAWKKISGEIKPIDMELITVYQDVCLKWHIKMIKTNFLFLVKAVKIFSKCLNRNANE